MSDAAFAIYLAWSDRYLRVEPNSSTTISGEVRRYDGASCPMVNLCVDDVHDGQALAPRIALVGVEDWVEAIKVLPSGNCMPEKTITQWYLGVSKAMSFP